MVEIRKIAKRSEIPFGPKYVLVMNGMRNNTTLHVHGATFVINNGSSNKQRVGDLGLALTKANEFAEDAKISTIYLLE